MKTYNPDAYVCEASGCDDPYGCHEVCIDCGAHPHEVLEDMQGVEFHICEMCSGAALDALFGSEADEYCARIEREQELMES